MGNSLSDFGFLPHIHCYLDQFSLVWTMVVTDSLIGISYVSISWSLCVLIKKIKLPFDWLFVAFGLFILACGITHFMEVYTLWIPNYWAAAFFKGITAIASIVTAVALYRLIPKIISFSNAAKQGNELEKVRESEAQFRTIADSIPQLAWMTQADGYFTWYNNRWYEYTGTKPEKVEGWGWQSVHSPDELPRVLNSWKEALRSGNPWEETFPLRSKEGEWRWFLSRATPLRDEKGVIIRWFGTHTDIEDTRRAREERRLENERSTFLAEASTILASSLDFRKTLVQVAQLVVPVLADWCSVTILKGERTQERVAIVHRDPDKSALLEELSRYYPFNADESGAIEKIIESGEPLFIPQVEDSHLVAAAKDQRHVEILRGIGCFSCIIVPIHAREKVLGVIALLSSRKDRLFNESDLVHAVELGRRAGIAIDNALLYEAAQKAVYTRDKFMSIASHELKTPLTVLKLQAQLRKLALKKGDVSRFSKEHLPQLVEEDEKQVNRLIRLVDDMLDVTRIQAGKLSLTRERFDLCELVQDILLRFSPQIQAQGCSVSFDSGSAQIGVWDRFRIEQVFINLLTNALKYGQQKPIQVRVESQAAHAVLKISDQGIGIEEKDWKRIFDQFERTEAAQAVGGLGLGLYISKKIIEAHDGTIEVKSELGKGTTFTIILPIGEGQMGLEISPANSCANSQTCANSQNRDVSSPASA